MRGPPEVGGRDGGWSNGLGGRDSILKANGLGFGWDMEDDRDIRPAGGGGMPDGSDDCEGIVGCVGEWKAEVVGVYARFVATERGCGTPVSPEPAPESECACRVTVGRPSGQELVREEFEENAVEGNGAGAVAGPEGSDGKSACGN